VNEAELVHSYILNCDRLSLYLNKEVRLGINESSRICRILKRRINGEPLQYILGCAEFMGLEFKVDKRVLIPRPETEVLVGAVLDRLKSESGLSGRPKILDLGTGSGCIAISIAYLLPEANVWAADISLSALQLAKKNAIWHKLKIKFLRSDIFSAFKKGRDQFDLIISNPPYVSKGELRGLAREISFEPRLALEAGVDGLEYYRRIISQTSDYLKDSGFLILEMGSGQRGAIESLIKKSKNFEAIEVIKDYNNIERVIVVRNSK